MQNASLQPCGRSSAKNIRSLLSAGPLSGQSFFDMVEQKNASGGDLVPDISEADFVHFFNL